MHGPPSLTPTPLQCVVIHESGLPYGLGCKRGSITAPSGRLLGPATLELIRGDLSRSWILRCSSDHAFRVFLPTPSLLCVNEVTGVKFVLPSQSKDLLKELWKYVTREWCQKNKECSTKWVSEDVNDVKDTTCWLTMTYSKNSTVTLKWHGGSPNGLTELHLFPKSQSPLAVIPRSTEKVLAKKRANGTAVGKPELFLSRDNLWEVSKWARLYLRLQARAEGYWDEIQPWAKLRPKHFCSQPNVHSYSPKV